MASSQHTAFAPTAYNNASSTLTNDDGIDAAAVAGSAVVDRVAARQFSLCVESGQGCPSSPFLQPFRRATGTGRPNCFSGKVAHKCTEVSLPGSLNDKPPRPDLATTNADALMQLNAAYMLVSQQATEPLMVDGEAACGAYCGQAPLEADKNPKTAAQRADGNALSTTTVGGNYVTSV